MGKIRKSKSEQEYKEFIKKHTLGLSSEGHEILDCSFEELVEGTGGIKGDELTKYFMDAAKKGLKKYLKYHIPPFTLFQSDGKYGLLNGNGDVIRTPNLKYCSVIGFEHCLQDDHGNVFEFDSSEGLVPIDIYENDEMPHFTSEEELLRHYKARSLEEADEIITRLFGLKFHE